MHIRIYTDGACSENPGPGGWAIVVNTPCGCNSLSGGEDSTTNNRMELLGMLEALRYITINAGKQYTCEIFCDSAYVVNSITKCWLDGWKLNGWKTKRGDDIKNRDLWELVYKCLHRAKGSLAKLEIRWIKGHDGHTFNEMADKLARAESMKRKAGAR